MTDLVRFDRDGPLGIITLDRPPLNLIDAEFLKDFLACLDEAGRDAACRCVVIESSSESTFCAGLDLKAARLWSEAELRMVLKKLYLGVMDRQAALGKPTIAAAAGIVRGGGITLCIQCDLIVCDASADFAYSEVDAGLVPAIHLSHLPRQTSRHLAFAPLFTGRPFGPEKAVQLGLVEEIAPAGEATARARALGIALAAKPPTTLRLARDAFHRTNERGHRAAVEDLIETFITARFGPDGREGVSAFAEKRTPRWPDPAEPG